MSVGPTETKTLDEGFVAGSGRHLLEDFGRQAQFVCFLHCPEEKKAGGTGWLVSYDGQQTTDGMAQIITCDHVIRTYRPTLAKFGYDSDPRPKDQDDFRIDYGGKFDYLCSDKTELDYAVLDVQVNKKFCRHPIKPVNLNKDVTTVGPKDCVFVFGHHDKEPMQISPGQVVLPINEEDKIRYTTHDLLHQASSAPCGSGGLVCNGLLIPVGLHKGNFGPGVNVAKRLTDIQQLINIQLLHDMEMALAYARLRPDCPEYVYREFCTAVHRHRLKCYGCGVHANHFSAVVDAVKSILLNTTDPKTLHEGFRAFRGLCDVFHETKDSRNEDLASLVKAVFETINAYPKRFTPAPRDDKALAEALHVLFRCGMRFDNPNAPKLGIPQAFFDDFFVLQTTIVREGQKFPTSLHLAVCTLACCLFRSNHELSTIGQQFQTEKPSEYAELRDACRYVLPDLGTTDHGPEEKLVGVAAEARRSARTFGTWLRNYLPPPRTVIVVHTPPAMDVMPLPEPFWTKQLVVKAIVVTAVVSIAATIAVLHFWPAILGKIFAHAVISTCA